METIQGDTFTVAYDPEAHSAIFSGALRLSGMEEYAPILALARRLLDEQERPATLDLQALEFLNSSGITMFSKFVIEARERKVARLRIVGSSLIPWQGRSLKNLQRLMPSLQIELV